MIPIDKLVEWGSFYDPEGLEVKKIKELVELNDKNILEIGCGTGRLTFKLEKYKNLTAIDKVKEYIEYGQEHNDNDKLKFVHATAGAMPFADSSFDLVIATWSLGGSDNLGKILWDAARVLKKKGVMLIIEESGLGDYEELKEKAIPGYKRRLRRGRMELKRQLRRFFDKIENEKIKIPEVYPDLETALKWFFFELEKAQNKKVENNHRIRKLMKEYQENDKVRINRGVMFVKAK